MNTTINAPRILILSDLLKPQIWTILSGAWAPNLKRFTPLIREPAGFSLHADPPLLQHVFTEVYDLLERVAVFAEFNANAECLSNEGSI